MTEIWHMYLFERVKLIATYIYMIPISWWENKN